MLFSCRARLLTCGASSMITRMKFRLVVEFDPQAKRWSAVFPELPGCGSAGDTEQAAIANAKEALALWFEPTKLELHKGAKLLEVALP
jgi:predicted RNase H-like HicB family nuclease